MRATSERARRQPAGVDDAKRPSATIPEGHPQHFGPIWRHPTFASVFLEPYLSDTTPLVETPRPAIQDAFLLMQRLVAGLASSRPEDRAIATVAKLLADAAELSPTTLSMHAASDALLEHVQSFVGRVRHLAVGILWLQEQQLRKAIDMAKIHGPKNPADLMTKSLAFEIIRKHMKELGIDFRSGRARSAVQLHAIRGTIKE